MAAPKFQDGGLDSTCQQNNWYYYFEVQTPKYSMI